MKPLDVINAFRNHVDEWDYLNGRCYDFFVFLRTFFPNAEPYYDGDHILTKIDGKYYDITGRVYKTKNHIPLCSSQMKKAHRWSKW